MRGDIINLDKIINFEKWQSLQDKLSLVTGIAIVTVDYKGNPITNHSGCSKFCQEVRKDPKTSKYCKKCDSRGGLEAIRINEPYMYLCHYNIVDIAIPINVNEKYMGAIMAGQIRLKDYNTEHLEKIVDTNYDKVSQDVFASNRDYYDDLPLFTYNQVKNISEMLSSLCNYLVEEALNKNMVLKLYEESIGVKSTIDSTLLKKSGLDNLQKIKVGISNALIDAHSSDDEYKEINKYISSTLKPAIEYIYNNKSENITAEKMAKVCHISQNYFSRLFSKEMGENFSAYVSKLKINWAKRLLEESDISINQISLDLGFNECGYFIKIFKKYEGVTPSVYRRYYKSE